MRPANRVRPPHYAGIALLAFFVALSARVPYPVNQAYIDTLRVGILSNSAALGTCPTVPNVGPQTEQFVVKALDATHIKNLKVLPSLATTVDSIILMFPGTLPHVLIHLNAGWAAYGGPLLDSILKWGAEHNIGIVEIGDDDLSPLSGVFPWVKVADSTWSPMTTAKWLDQPDDSLFIRLLPGSDVEIDSAAYPNLTGIIRNTTSKILQGDSTLHFIPKTPEGRCEADPDVAAIDPGYERNARFMGYQQGYNASYDPSVDSDSVNPVGEPGYYNAVSVFQDTILIGESNGMRRAVSLSLQPQFLQNDTAIGQIIYDAVIYASLVHFTNPPTPSFEIGVRRFGRANGAHLAGPATLRMVDLRGRSVAFGNAQQVLWKARGAGRPGVYILTGTSPASGRAQPVLIGR